MHLVERMSSSHSLGSFSLACQQALLFGQVKRATREWASERWSRKGPFFPPPPCFRVSSPVYSPRWRACLQSTFLLTFIFSFQLPAAVGEAPTFGFTEHMANKFFKPEGVRSLTITYMTVVVYLFWQPKYFLLLDVIFVFHWEIYIFSQPYLLTMYGYC